MQKKVQFKKKSNKPYFNKNKNQFFYSNKNKNQFFYKKKNKNQFFYKKKNNIYYILGEKKPEKPLTTAYLQRNKKKKIGMFFKEPSYKTILYPFHLNLKLINEYLKKK